MPLGVSERINGNRVDLSGWLDGETKKIKFVDNGRDFAGRFGFQYVYRVLENGEEKLLYVRPNGALAIALQKYLSNETPLLTNRTFEVTKLAPVEDDYKNIRYDAKEVKK